jgi:hypothetical protein
MLCCCSGEQPKTRQGSCASPAAGSCCAVAMQAAELQLRTRVAAALVGCLSALQLPGLLFRAPVHPAVRTCRQAAKSGTSASTVSTSATPAEMNLQPQNVLRVAAGRPHLQSCKSTAAAACHAVVVVSVIGSAAHQSCRRPHLLTVMPAAPCWCCRSSKTSDRGQPGQPLPLLAW